MNILSTALLLSGLSFCSVQINSQNLNSYTLTPNNSKETIVSRGLIVVLSNKSLYVKSGLNDKWLKVHDNVTSYQLEGNRIGIISGGTLFVKEGRLDALWVRVHDNVTSFQLQGNRIGVVSGETLFAKEGKLDARWVRERDNVTSFLLEGDRIGVVSGGNLYVKEGPLNASWVAVYNGLTSFTLEQIE